MKLFLLYLKNIFKNLKYLIKNDLLENEDNLRLNMFENMEYYINNIDNIKNKRELETIKILSNEETVDLLLKRPKSFCRFGDGEIALICGKSISFQKYSEKLGTILLEILKNTNDNLYVGINDYFNFNSLYNQSEFTKKFYLKKTPGFRKFLLGNCNKNGTYISAGFNQVYISTNDLDYESYFNKIKKLFLNRELVIFVGKGVLDNLKYDVFEYAKSKEFVYGPSKNSYDVYDELLKKARLIDKNKTLLFILGPCSKVLIYELSKEGYLAWDIGHLAKDYDAYKKGIKKTDSNIINFFRPD